MAIEIYIFVHNKLSYNFFKLNNPYVYKYCKIVWLGENVNIPNEINSTNIIIPCTLGYNIEKYKTFLTFTGWYAISKNFISKSNYVGFFEYDVKFNTNPFDLKLTGENTIYGCFKRDLPDPLFLDKFPNMWNTVLLCVYGKILNKQTYWAPTTNFIVTHEFLVMFVDWFYKKIEDIKQMPNHAHFMERAINIFAWSKKYKIEILENLIYHYNSNSHQLSL
jgi:hypothetical protein